MFKTNNFLSGILIGAVFPGIAWLTFHVFFNKLILMDKPIIPYLAAILANMILIRTFHRNGAEQTTRGIMLVSFIFLIFIFLVQKV